MTSQEQSPRQQSPYDTAGQASGVDLDIAESLIQHSRGERGANGDSMPIATEGPGAGFSDKQEAGDDASENGQGPRQSNSQERQSDLQYAPISNPPALGQVCR